MLPKIVLHWLTNQLQQPYTIQALAGDASFRQYFRCNADKNYILSYEPQQPNQVLETIDKFNLLARNKLPVPNIYAFSEELGLTLQTDLGTTTLYDLKNDQSFFKYAYQSIELINTIIKIPTTKLPHFNKQHIKQELELVPKWLLKITNTTWSTQQQQSYNNICDKLIHEITKLTPVVIHRDFHSRNIMIFDNKPFLIDAQDAMLGPCLYDFASLTKDCYITWPDLTVQELLNNFYETNKAYFKSKEHCYLCFDFISIQRHLKAIGIFARLSLRDKKHQYLNDINPTLNKIRTNIAKHPDLSILDKLLPAKI
jgi:aminoglycoside/choline kinase family phosphotransferase